jgi:hypothetical protein
MAVRYAALGDSVLLDPQEEARLDAAGALAPIGATREQVMHAVDQQREEYEAARRQLPEGFDAAPGY